MRWLPWLKKDEDDVPQTPTQVRPDETIDEAAARHAVFALAGMIQDEAHQLASKANGLLKEIDSDRSADPGAGRRA